MNTLNMEGKRVTLQDIADAAGTAKSTVSWALRKDPRIPVATQKRIKEVAEKLGYKNNPYVSAWLSYVRTSKRSNYRATIGFIHPFSNPDPGELSTTNRRLYEGVRDRAEELGYTLDILITKQAGMTDQRLTEIATARGIIGLIIPDLPSTVAPLTLGWEHFSSAVLGYSLRKPDLHRACCDHFESVNLALRHAKRLGYRHPGLAIRTQADQRVGRNWLAGFLIEYHASKPTRSAPIYVSNTWTRASFQRWLKKDKPDVVIGNEPILLDWIRETGARVPEDIGFVTLEWLPDQPEIAGIDQKSELVAAAAVDLIIGQLHRSERGIPSDPKVVMIEGRWKDGDTMAPRSS